MYNTNTTILRLISMIAAYLTLLESMGGIIRPSTLTGLNIAKYLKEVLAIATKTSSELIRLNTLTL